MVRFLNFPGVNVDVECNLGDNNANIHHKNKLGYTALHYAAEKGFYSTVVQLIAWNMAIDCKSNHQVPPLMLASRKGSVDIVKLFLKHHADINLKDFEGQTALYYAIKSRKKKLVDLLLRNGAHVFLKDNYKISPLKLALDYSSTHPITIYLKKITYRPLVQKQIS